ncbi:MAG: phosphoribosylformylglycinamidine synthase subunit PurS [Bacteroidota bacterium]|nr:phosphoribosylformylglycinamidine synthase subunit PurS [Bacteroidota bacterium]MDX5430676.1 phosphoribosylformylglycinamidine synthase subunit PurS [Bacteroidota bacterium]MDX5469423.1 phosphoribosylformylglycinamidine synthase subunit PurS [Bacteroidota bacterium]
MKYLVEINVMPHKALLDPQGKAVTNGLKSIGLSDVEQVRVGKRITMELEAADANAAQALAEEACKKLLANQVMEYFEIQVAEHA